MKIRNGFISNSSSCSFVVYINVLKLDDKNIPQDIIYTKKEVMFSELEGNFACVDAKCITLPTEKGISYFGWEDKRHTNLLDRLNWCALQIILAEAYRGDVIMNLVTVNKEQGTINMNELDEIDSNLFHFKKLFETVVKEELGLCVRYDYNSIMWDAAGDYEANIDHKSMWWVCSSNADVFKTPRALKAFLFNKDSYVQCGNDNYEMGEEYRESLKKMNYRLWKYLQTIE